jgi:hypothetical protein
MKYNEKEVGNNLVLYSTDKNEKFPYWGLYDKSSEKDILPPTYFYDGKGIFNGYNVLLFRDGGSKKLYLIDKKKLLFKDYDLIGKEWTDLPELYSKKYGNIYYAMKEMMFYLINEDGKVLHESDMPLKGKIKILDGDGKVLLVTYNEIIDIETKLPIDTKQHQGSKVDAFSIKDNLFIILKTLNQISSQYSIMHWESKQIVVEYFNYVSKEKFAVTSSAFYVKEGDNRCVKYDEQGKQVDAFDFDMGGLIVINDRVIVGVWDKGITVDLDTGKKVMDGVAFSLIPDSHLIITSSTKGVYRGIKDFDKNRVLAPAIFTHIDIEPKIMCLMGKTHQFEFDFSKKSFTTTARHLLIPVMFSLNWEDKKWE